MVLDHLQLSGRHTMLRAKGWNAILVSLILVFVTACQQQPQTVAELPTLAVLPTLTASHTPTDTPTLTRTPTSTSTPTPTFTSTATPTPTFTATTTSTASATPTFTLTATATQTPTNTPTATPDAPQIIAFTASGNNVAPGTAITLSWQTIADAARIDQLNQQGVATQSFPVQPNGQLPVTIPPGIGQLVVYKLTAQRGGKEATASLPITVTCAIDWFFGRAFAPPGSGCPRAVGAIGPGAFQQFERGFMIYVNANNLNTVYGLQTQDSRYIAYTNGWDGTTIDNCGTPPQGLFAPQNMFNWAYCRTNAPVGSWNSAVGWATGGLDTGNRTIQFEEGTGAFYIDAPVGVFRFSGPAPAGTTWQRIK
jgi:hypothetical protein